MIRSLAASLLICTTFSAALGLAQTPEEPAVAGPPPAEEVVLLGDAQEWLYDVSGKQYRISLVRRDGSVFMLHRFDDGKLKEYEVVFLDKKRFAKKASSNGNWIEVDANGDLVIYKNNGQNTENARKVPRQGAAAAGSGRPGVLDEGDTLRRAGEERKQKRMDLLKEELARLEEEKVTAVKKQWPKLIAELTKKVKAKQEQLDESQGKSVEDYLNEMRAEGEAAQLAARQKAIEESRPPLEITATGINPNVINMPKLTIEVRNTKDIAVEAFEVDVECFDKFGDPVNWPGKGNLFSGISQNQIGAKQTTRASWDLHLHQNTTKAKVWITRVKLGNGSVWSQSRVEASRAGGLVSAESMR